MRPYSDTSQIQSLALEYAEINSIAICARCVNILSQSGMVDNKLAICGIYILVFFRIEQFIKLIKVGFKVCPRA